MSRYAFIASYDEPWPVQVLCQVLAVSTAGYQWRQRPAAAPAPWQVAAQAAFTRAPRPMLRHPAATGRVTTQKGTPQVATPCNRGCTERAYMP